MCFNSGSKPSIPDPPPVQQASPAPPPAPSPLPPPEPLVAAETVDPVKMGGKNRPADNQQAAMGTSALRIPLGSSSQTGGGINVG